MEAENILRLNHLFKVISTFEEIFYDEFSKTGIKKCGMCFNGLKSKHNVDDFCEHCGGIGYTGIEKMYGEFVCRRCRGGGCTFCNHKGTVDWITHSMGKDLINPRKAG